jgi:FkbM family methyltransferase
MKRGLIGGIKAEFHDKIISFEPKALKQRIGNEVIIYGAGNAGKDIFKILKNKKYKVRCFIDLNARRLLQWSDIPIYTPDSKEIEAIAREDLCVIIGVFNKDVDIISITKLLKSRGFSTIINFAELFQVFPEELGNRFWLSGTEYLLKNESVIDESFELFKDTASRDLFKAILGFRMTGDFSLLSSPDPSPQYFPRDIPLGDYLDRFVDCGAFDGDTIQLLNKTIGKINAILCFEPDMNNYQKLSSYVENNPGLLANEILLVPCGVWSKSTSLRFSDKEGAASHLATNEDVGTTIQCVALNDAIAAWHPTYIKMDIEGAEYDGLLGSERIIRSCKPLLAICVYHRPEDIWEIPLLLQSWNLGYSFYLRCYGQATFDSVLYAIPKK